MTQSILIVDDEAPARERLERMIKSIDSCSSITSAKNGYEALDKIKSSPPDILFLDIQMPEMNGFDILRNLEHRPFSIVFQTAYDQFAINAFEESASDYLLKPFEIDRLKKAYHKAIQDKIFKVPHQLDNVLNNHKQYIEKLMIKQGNTLTQIKVCDIDFFTSKDHYTCAYIGEKEYVLDLSLSYLENQLDPKTFFRCHRSQIISLSKISRLELGPQMYVIYNSSIRVEVSRQNRSKMRDLFRLQKSSSKCFNLKRED